MHRIDAKSVPRLLTNDQKQRRVNVCLELREKANEDLTFISWIITGDESWISFPNLKLNWRDYVLKLSHHFFFDLVRELYDSISRIPAEPNPTTQLSSRCEEMKTVWQKRSVARYKDGWEDISLKNKVEGYKMDSFGLG
jgi:hypothetical protein